MMIFLINVIWDRCLKSTCIKNYACYDPTVKRSPFHILSKAEIVRVVRTNVYSSIQNFMLNPKKCSKLKYVY